MIGSLGRCIAGHDIVPGQSGATGGVFGDKHCEEDTELNRGATVDRYESGANAWPSVSLNMHSLIRLDWREVLM